MTTMTPTLTRTITDQELLVLERSYWDASRTVMLGPSVA